MPVVERPGGTRMLVPDKPGVAVAATTTADFEEPVKKPKTAREKRIAAAEARVEVARHRVEVAEPFVPHITTAELEAAQEELAEIMAAEDAADTAAAEQLAATREGIEELQRETVEALRKFCDLREELGARRAAHDDSWRAAMARGLDAGARVLPVQVAAARDGDLADVLGRAQYWTNRSW